MTAGIRTSQGARGVFVAMAFLVLLIRTLVPSGFMPVAMDDKIVIQVCTGAGAASIVIDRDKSPAPADQHKASDHPCTWSGGFSGGLLDMGSAPLVLPFLPAGLLPLGAAVADLTVHRLAAPPPPAIGPPLNA